ncbi:MAG: ATP-binding protein [Desulfobacterales bacterium]|nr:ATP-binding protein [Desulfobacterales bacterium]
MIISIASGKGGTGKTTVAANLSTALGGKITLLDCDVEEPNAHLFLNPTFTGEEKVIAPVPEVDLDRCTQCKKCMDVCQFNAIAIVGKAVVTFPELCHSCGGCKVICPEDAVTEVERVLGHIETGHVDAAKLGAPAGTEIQFIHGKLDIGQVMVPPIIKQVKTHADDGGLTLIDAPPGTSCPVIAAMKDTDFVLLVTEPTPFGLHDLKLAVEAVRLMGIPHGLVINRAGMGNDDVKTYARKKGVPILMEIPFDKRIAQAYSKGELMVTALPEYREKFTALFEKIERMVEAGRANQ